MYKIVKAHNKSAQQFQVILDKKHVKADIIFLLRQIFKCKDTSIDMIYW